MFTIEKLSVTFCIRLGEQVGRHISRDSVDVALHICSYIVGK